ncbi:tetratricopeptide repeat protein [Endozoicomonas sp. ALD040]|uniref:tetratricopeptide repeat protein n=1 Tax=Endozoicomonas sp. ALD040 TaxID=3403079 RepID=UPI003BB11ECE
MSYGLPPITNPATSATPQPPQNADSVTTERRFTLNPEAAPFVPRNQGADQWNTPSNIRDRQATERKTDVLQKFHRWREKPTYPDDTVKRINDAYDALKTQKFRSAEVAFQSILCIDQDVLSQYDYQKMHIGLARSLNEQTRAKQEEACSLLKELRSKAPLNEFGASIIHNLDLTLSRSELALGRYLDAETRLLRMRNKKPDADVKALCEPSDDFDADMTITRVWQFVEKHTLTETLLLNMKTRLTEKLQQKQSAAAVEKLHQKLRTVNIVLVRQWEQTGQYKLAEELLLNVSGKNPNNSEEELCKPSGQFDLDLTLARLWQTVGKHKRTEKLLLNMSNKPPDANEETLCTPCGNYLTDLALMRYWEQVGNNQLAEKLLLKMSGKHLDASEEELCKPCWHHEIDLTLVRYWEVVGKYTLAEKLLLNMTGKHPGASIDSLCSPCGNLEIDLARVRLWQMMGKYQWSEQLMLKMIGKPPGAIAKELCKPFGHHNIDLTRARLWQNMNKFELSESLLLNMSGKHLNADEDSLFKPSGNQQIDLALIRLWTVMGKFEEAERLSRRCCELYHSDECQLTLLGLSAGKAGFLEMISRYPESANTLLVTSIHYFSLACKHITNDDPKAGSDHLMKALEIVESALEKYPVNSGAYSQKGHCLRMLGRSEQEWREWFNRAESLDPGRAYRSKTDFWRGNEATALQKLRGLTKKLPDQVPG